MTGRRTHMLVNPNVVIIQYITGIGDLLYNKNIDSKDIATSVGPILNSAKHYGIPVHLLTNSPEHVKVTGLNVENMQLFNYDQLSVYFHRIDLTFKFLLKHPEISNAAIVDAGDVEMLNYPFDQIEDDILYIGSENIKVKDSWIIKNNNNPTFINQFLLANGHLSVLNLGVVIGSRKILLEYFGMMSRIISESKVKQLNSIKGFELGTFEMALSNYVAYKYFSNRLVYGRKVTTKFTAYEPRSSSWFRHK